MTAANLFGRNARARAHTHTHTHTHTQLLSNNSLSFSVSGVSKTSRHCAATEARGFQDACRHITQRLHWLNSLRLRDEIYVFKIRTFKFI